MNPNKIIDISFYRAVSPRSIPIADATHQIPIISFIICEITLTSGVTGQGYLLSFHYNPHAILGALKDMAEFMRNGYLVDKMAHEYTIESEYFGHDDFTNIKDSDILKKLEQTWGKEIHLRDDGRELNLGYTRSVQRNDTKIVTVYYISTAAKYEQHIAATMWNPDQIK
jgi:hypothetical protein